MPTLDLRDRKPAADLPLSLPLWCPAGPQLGMGWPLNLPALAFGAQVHPGPREHVLSKPSSFAEGFQSWMWRGLTFLLPFLFFGQVSVHQPSWGRMGGLGWD